MNEDIREVVQGCRIVDGLIGLTEDELEQIYTLGRIQGKIDMSPWILSALEKIQE